MRKKKERKRYNECALCTISRDERNEKNERVCYIFWLCSMAEHIKLGSNPSSQYLPHLVCCYILYIFVHITHTNMIHRWMDQTELKARNYSQVKSLILGVLGCYYPSRKEEKIEFMVIIVFDISYWRHAPIMHCNLKYLWI